MSGAKTEGRGGSWSKQWKATRKAPAHGGVVEDMEAICTGLHGESLPVRPKKKKKGNGKKKEGKKQKKPARSGVVFSLFASHHALYRGEAR